VKFHLDHIPEKPGFTIRHSDFLFLTGSCFSGNIGQRLTDLKFKTAINPAGILFNPLSISDSIKSLIENAGVSREHIIEREGSFYTFDFHSSVHAKSGQDLVAAVRDINSKASRSLKEARFLFITFGTAFAYRLRSTGKVVANCHKQPSGIFDKILPSPAEIEKEYSQLLGQLKAFNPGLKIIFTVSPVKHLNDGVEENSLSKSTLILTVHNIIEQNPGCSYFPSYELVTDDLRDYRFYKTDLAHPNDMAIDYVFGKFSDCYFDSKTRELCDHIRELNAATRHRPLNEVTDEKLSRFIASKKAKIMSLDHSIELQ
jgi:hypothetical protein